MRPYLRAANVTWSGLDLRDVKEMNFTEDESEVYELRPGDVLVAEASGSADEVGKPALWRGEIDSCCFQNTLIRVRTLGPLPEYLRYFLLAEAESGRIGEASPGVGIHHIGATRLAAWRVALPPLAEQRRIVAAIEEHLSRLDAAEHLLRQAAARIRVLRESIANELAENGSPVRLAECLAEPLVNGRSVQTKPDGFPVLRLSCLRDGVVDLHERKLGSWDPIKAEPFLVQKGDFFVARGNGSLRLVGRGGLVRVKPDEVAFPDTLIRVRVTPDRVIPEYLRLVWDSQLVREQIEGTARTTAGIYKINQQDLRNIVLRLPDVADQPGLVATAEAEQGKADSLAKAVEDARRRTTVLRTAILAQAFRGQLVPQDPTDEAASVLLERIAAEREAAPAPTRKQRVTTPA
jgi:type I restriction enzyme S subunit